MSHVNTIYNQLLHLVPRHEFESLVNMYDGDRYVKYFTCWQQFMSLLYAQVRTKDSLRDIQTSLMAQSDRWYHIGLKDIKRSTLSDANNSRNYQIYEDFFYKLLERCRDITPKHKFRFQNPLYTMDATVIDVCLSMFPWATFRKKKGALKLHYLYDHSGAIPSFLVVTDAKQHEIKVAKEQEFPLVPDSIVSMDKAYIDYKWLYSLDKSKISFVTRAKRNMKCQITGQHEVNKKRGLLFDRRVVLTNFYQSRYYPKELRLVGFKDPETKKKLVFMTNNFSLSAYTIAQIFKARWQIELFFKWIKQNLKIKSFFGTSRNAVLTQIWIAMCYYLLLSYIKYQTKYSYSLLELSRIFSEMIFARISLIDLLSFRYYNISRIREPALQRSLF